VIVDETEMLKDLLASRWLWITIVGSIAVVTLPWFLIYFIVVLPFPLNAILNWTIIIGWGVAAGYKDWQLYKKKEEKWVHGMEKTKPRDYPT